MLFVIIAFVNWESDNWIHLAQSMYQWRTTVNFLAKNETNKAFLKTTVSNNVSVLDFIMHYLLHVSAPIGGHLQVKCT
jgi:hypothetical protein